MTPDRLPSLCWACAAGFHRHEGTSCDCTCHAPFGENPRYGPGNPDWEHDRAREGERA